MVSLRCNVTSGEKKAGCALGLSHVQEVGKDEHVGSIMKTVLRCSHGPIVVWHPFLLDLSVACALYSCHDIFMTSGLK